MGERESERKDFTCFFFCCAACVQNMFDLHPSASTLKALSDFDVKLVQRLLYYTTSDLWLSDEDKDWPYPLLVTLRETTHKLERQVTRGLGSTMAVAERNERRPKIQSTTGCL